MAPACCVATARFVAGFSRVTLRFGGRLPLPSDSSIETFVPSRTCAVAPGRVRTTRPFLM